uniref:NAD-dependent epimerase/dehydratase family protein n=1 Tax=uncultured Rhizobium sp. TaxID=155567 RepID=UPI0026377137
MKVFVTGSAGFIGFHIAKRFLQKGLPVAGYDGVTPGQDAYLKSMRLAQLAAYPRYVHTDGMLEDATALRRALEAFAPDIVIHLAGSAGVRDSLENPWPFVSGNINGTFNLLEIARDLPIRHLLMASSSSVYGANLKFAEADHTDEPITVYAATKKSMEVMAHAYAHLWRIPITAMRFFTVYGPYGRSNMAIYRFVEAIARDRPIDIYGTGVMCRDFTYIDDLVEAVDRLALVPPQPETRVHAGGVIDTLSSHAPFRIVNIGSGDPATLMELVAVIEQCLGKPAIRRYLDMQTGDVPYTCASTALLNALVGPLTMTPLRSGIEQFVRWY